METIIINNSEQVDYSKITKKEFKEQCSFHEYGKGMNKRNAIYFDWKSEKNIVGYRFMVKANVQSCKKDELYNELYNWVTLRTNIVPYYVQYKYARTDSERFKVPIVG